MSARKLAARFWVNGADAFVTLWHAGAVSVAVIAVFPVHPEKIDEFFSFFRTVLPATRGYDGCEVLETFVDMNDPGRVVLWERWPTKDHHRRYLAWRNESDLGDKLAPYLSGRPSFTYLESRPDV